MSKRSAKRNMSGQFTKRRSPVFIIGTWVVGLASLGLVWLASRAVMSDFGGFRSCNGNTNILTVSSCGKHSLNLGDFVMLGLFILSVCFSVSLLTGAWRMTKRGALVT
jgi:hypothetical protein